LMICYDYRAYKNLSSSEAMDAAQVARNLSEGKGFTTQFIRPFSMNLIRKRSMDKLAGGESADQLDLARIKGEHPDLANPPLYPLVLAGVMKAAPFDFTISKTRPFWSSNNRFLRYQPDFLLAIFNQVLFAVAAVMLFFLARRLFDSAVAWTSTILFLGTELLWRFSTSGLSTMFLLIVFIGLAWALTRFEHETREPSKGQATGLGLAALVGVMVGLTALTRYSCAVLIIPALACVMWFSGQKRVVFASVTLLGFLVTLGPWVLRNYSVSGTFFGIPGYALMENSYLFPDFRLQRSLDPDVSRSILGVLWTKLTVNTRDIFRGELPKFGGSWVSAFFLVGLLVNFRSPAARRIRYFILLCLPVLILAQALGRTRLSEDAPEVNTENLLVLLTPLVLVYGVSLFYMLLEQIAVPVAEARYAIIGGFGFVVCLPLLFVFVTPKTIPLAYPPYDPPSMQKIAEWLQPKELIMTDIPWATAWYAHRQSVWLTLNATPNPRDPAGSESFVAINDYYKPIAVLYLTQQTMDGKFLTDWYHAGQRSWGGFIIDTVLLKEVPRAFPLHKSLPGWLPEQLMLSDWERWLKSSQTTQNR